MLEFVSPLPNVELTINADFRRAPDQVAARPLRATVINPVGGFGASPLTIYKSCILSTEKSQFRLFEFQPSPDPGGQISIRLFKASLAIPPQYAALSYRWEGSKDHHILVNSVKLPVMSNLYSALREMHSATRARASGARGTRRYFWVDSICINQASREEKTKQVGLMGQIYSRASSVRVWLGNAGSTDVAAAFRLVKHCGQNLTDAQVVDAVREDRAGAESLTELLHRSYWTRMWMFQEVVLSQNTIVHCGSHQAPWSSFTRLDRISGSHGLWTQAQISHRWILDLRRALFRIAHFSVSEAQARHVHNILQPTRHLQCHDPRDKLYALLGVCPTLRAMMASDYTKTARGVYITFAKNQMQSERNLSLLASAGLWDPANGENIDLPSWVPDLRGIEGVDIRYLAGSFLKRFSAAGSSVGACFEFLDECENVLVTQGIVLDTVQSHQNLDKGRDPHWKGMIHTFCRKNGTLSPRSLRQFFRAMIFEDTTIFGQLTDETIERDVDAGVYSSIERKIRRKLYRKVYGNLSAGEYLPPLPAELKDRMKQRVKKLHKETMKRLIIGFLHELWQHFQSERAVLIEFLESFKDIGIDMLRAPDGLESLNLHDAEEVYLQWREFMDRASQTTDKGISAVFDTVNGHIGIGPRIVRPGDRIALVPGCRVPLILRQDEAFFRLVGPCYVSGIMQGEAVRQMGRRKVDRIQII